MLEIVQVRRVGSHVKPDRGRPDVVEEFDTPAFRAALEQTVRKWKPAIAQLEFTQMAMYASDCAPAKTVMVEHDVTIDLYQQLLENSEDWELRRQLEQVARLRDNAWASTDCVVVMSEKDRATVSNARKIVTLANGVDIERYQPSAADPEPNRLLFLGSFAHLPNLLAVDFFLREVWPLLGPAVRIYTSSRDRSMPSITSGFGTGSGFRWNADVTIDGFVADVRPAYRRLQS